MSYLRKKVCDNAMLGAWKNCKIAKLRDMNVLPEGQCYWQCSSVTGNVAVYWQCGSLLALWQFTGIVAMLLAMWQCYWHCGSATGNVAVLLALWQVKRSQIN
jgi:hypothetical protein